MTILQSVEGPVVKPAAHEQVSQRLRHAIRSGSLAPDDRLPSEPELARVFGVSRMTLRAALRELREEGYVVSLRGAKGGLFVSNRAAQRESTRAQIARRRDDLQALMEYREAIEPKAAALAASRRRDATVRAMREAVEAMRDSASIPAFRQADTSFHRTLAAAAGNRYIETALDETRAGLFGLVDLADYDVLVSRSVPEHAEILDAIATGRSQDAYDAMLRHVRSARDEVNEVIRVTLGEASRG